MQPTKTSIMASERTFVGWVFLVGTGLFWNGRVCSGRGITLIIRVLRWWHWTTISVVVALHRALIIGTGTGTRIIV